VYFCSHSDDSTHDITEQVVNVSYEGIKNQQSTNLVQLYVFHGHFRVHLQVLYIPLIQYVTYLLPGFDKTGTGLVI
jgi:hypothetical protein